KNQAEEKMKEINQAYKILGDKEKRQNYDRYGSEEPFFRQGSGGFGEFGSSGSIFEDILENFGFGGGTKYRQKETYTAQGFEPQTGSDLLFSRSEEHTSELQSP